TTIRFNFSYNGTAQGDENLTFTPVADAVFDISGNAASTTQSNNELQLHDETDPTITGITLAEASGSHNVDLAYYIDVEFSEGVYGATFDDFDLDVVDAATIILHTATQTNGDALVGGETTIRLNITLNTYGTSEGSAINVTVNPESIFDQANNDVPLFDQATTATIDQALPAVESLLVDADNSVLTVYFNEAIYADDAASLPIEASHLDLSVSEGAATDVSITNVFGPLDADLAGGESQLRVHFTLLGTPNGEERLTINAADNSSIFDGSGNNMVSPQLSNNHRLINDIYAPVFTSATSVNFVENGEGTVYTAAAIDISTVTYSLANSNDETFFNIDGSTGAITFKNAPDFENAQDGDSNNDYVIGVVATDDQGNADEQEVTVIVTDSDEIAPLFTSVSTASFDENGEGTVYIAIATDGGSVTFSLANANDEEFFNIDSSTGELTFKVVPDFETPQDADANNSYIVVVKATDGESNESTLEVTITVTDLDENAPVFTSASTASYVENGEGTVYTAMATDVGTVTYSLADSNDEEFFDLNASTGVLTFIAAPDFENPLDADGNNSYMLVMKATDDSANESTLELAVTVTDLDEEAPVFTSATTVSFDENASGTVYTATVSDSESETITFALGSDKDESVFSIDGSTGVLTFISPPDFENPASESGSNNYEIDIKATDQANNESTLTLIISVNDQDEVAPVFTSSSSASFAENDEGTIYTSAATDDGVITYSLGDSNDEEFFNLDGSNGQLTFKAVPDFENPQDADLNNSYVLVLIATDDSGNESTLELTVTVTSQNEDPVITSNPITEIDDNEIYSYKVTTTDPDGDNVTVTSNALPSWLKLYGENEVFTFAGNGQSGSTNANLLSSSFNIPIGVAEDSQGNLYVADLFNHTIRRISTDGQVTTFAGTGSVGSQDGTGTEASFNEPSDLAIDSQDNIFVVDRENHAIRKITPAGVVTHFVGGTGGYEDGTGTAARVNRPTQIAIDDNDNLYITDQNNFRIRKITSAGVVTTIAGSGVNGFQDGDAGTAQFSQLTGIGVDSQGNIYVSDYDNARIRKIDIAGNVTTLAGSGTRSIEDGLGSEASFYSPLGMDVDDSGNIYVAEVARVIRKIEPSGQVTTIVGSAFETGTDDGVGAEAKFTEPNNVFIDSGGNLFITEGVVHLIRKVVVNGPILTGNPSGQSGATSITLTADDGNGGTDQQSFTITINDVTAPVFTSSGTASFTENASGTVYTALATDVGSITYSLGTSVDEEFFTIDSNTGEITFLSSPDFENPLDGDANNSYVLIVKATDAATNESTLELMVTVSDVDEDAPVFTSAQSIGYNENALGTVYTAVSTDEGTITYSLGNSVDEEYFSIDSNTGEIAFLSTPDFENPLDGDANNSYALIIKASDSEGNESTLELLISVIDLNEEPVISSSPITTINSSEEYVYTIEVSDPDDEPVQLEMTQGPSWLKLQRTYTTVETFAGSGNAANVNGQGVNASFGSVGDIVIDNDDNVFVGVGAAHVLKKIDNEGNVTTYAGILGVGGSVDGSLQEATFGHFTAMTFDNDGNLFIVDGSERKIRKISTEGLVTTVAGSGVDAVVNGSATEAAFSSPVDIAVDSQGNLFIAETNDHTIRKIDTDGNVSTFAGSGLPGFVNANGTDAYFNSPTSLVIDSEDNLYVTDISNFHIRKITPQGEVTSYVGKRAFGNVDAQGENAVFSSPYRLAIDSDGNLYVTELLDFFPPTIRKVDTEQSVTTIAGSTEGYLDGAALEAQFGRTLPLDIDSRGRIYIADEDNYRVRRVNSVITLTGDPEGQVGEYNISISASDGNGAQVNQTFTLTVNDNESPAFTSASTASFTENNEGTVYTAIATDAGNITYSLGTSVDEEYFAIDSNTGVITFLNTPDFENPLDGDANNSYVLIVKATDDEGNESTLELMVTVTDVDEDRPVFTSDETASFTENDEGTVYTAVASDAGTITYSLGTSVDEEYFAIDSSTGEITFLSTPDFESPLDGDANNSYVLIVKATDDQGNESTLELMVTITDVDEDRPVFTSAETASFTENDEGTVYTAVASDAGTITYSLGTSVDEEYFAIDSNTGEITFLSTPDFENPLDGDANNSYVLIVKATDNEGNESTLELMVTVTDVDEDRPIFTSSETASFSENADGTVYTAVATDYGTITYSLGTSADEEYLAIDSSTGEITFLSTPDFETPLDGDANNSYVLIVKATDNEGNESTLELMVTVTDVDEDAPVFTSSETASFTENASGTVYTAVAEDEGAIIYSLGTSVDEEYFAIDSNSGEITFLSAPDFETPLDGDANNSYVLIVKATDNEANESTLELLVTVIDVDEDRPVFTSAETASFIENNEGIVYTASATDAGTITYSLGTSVDEEYFNIDSSTGEITFLSAPDFENPLDGDANNSYVLIVKATDDEGNESTLELMVTVIDVTENTSPVITSTPKTSIEAGSNYSYTITFTDVDNDPVAITTSTRPEWLTLDVREIGVSTLTGSGSGYQDGNGTEAKFRNPTGIAINSLGELFIADQSNNVIRKVSVDGTVSTFAGNGSLGATNGNRLQSSFSRPIDLIFDSEENLYVVELTGHRIRKISSSGEVTTFVGSESGYQDGQGSVARFYFPSGITRDLDGNFYVVDANHTIRKITMGGMVTTLAGNGSSGDIDGQGADARFNYPYDVYYSKLEQLLYVTDLLNHKIKTVSLGGVVSTIAGSSQGNRDGGAFVSQFNEPKRIAVDSEQNIWITDSENDAIRKISVLGEVSTVAGGQTFGFNDGNIAEALFNGPTGILIDLNDNLVITDDGNHRIRKLVLESMVTLSGVAPSSVGIHQVNIRAEDGNGGEVEQSFAIAVEDTTNPIFSSESTTDFTENSEGIVYTASATDVGTITYSLAEANDEELFTINGSTGELTFKSAPDFESPQDADLNNSYVLVLKATDEVGNASTLELTVTVTDVDDDILEGSLSINDVTRAENADVGSTTDFIFTVTLSDNVGSAFTVDYGTGDNTATTAGSDYSATSGTLNFTGTAGETQQIIVTVNNDDILEADETFGVQLVNLQANGQSITIADDTGVGTITNDDQSTLSISDITKVEGNSGTTDFTFSVTMTGAVDQQVTVDYATSDGTATIANGDYNATSGTLTFSGADGESQTITVAVNGDATEELNESFTISLSNVQDGGKGVSFAKSTALSTIANDDDNVAPSGFSVSFDDQSIGGNEVSSSTFTFSGAEVGAVYNYSITSAGGGTTVTGSGTIATAADQISIPDLSGLNDGLLTLSATLTDGSSNVSESQRSTTNLDKTGPIPVISSSASGLIFTKTITATITFNEEITGLTIDDLSATNSVLSNFTGSGTTYTVLMTASADGEMTLTVPANVTADGLGNKNTVSNTLLTKVEAFNAAPSGLGLSDKTITEKLPIGTVIGEFSTTDPDDNDRHQYSLIAGEGSVNNNLFEIVDNQLRTKQILDFQKIQTANIRVRTTDLRGSSFEKSFDIEVINQPEPRALVRFIYPSGYATNRHDFGRLFVGQEASVSLQISNVGIDGDLNVSDIKLPDGYEASETEFVVAQGETQKIEVKFSPKESKYFSGYGQVMSNGGTPQFLISGYGLINHPPVAFDFPLRSIELSNRVVSLNGYDPERSSIEFVITQSPQKGSFIDATPNSDRRSKRFLPQAGLTPGRYKDEFKFKVREVATGVESEEASGEFYFEIQDTKHEINDIRIIERTEDYIALDLTFTDETVNSSYFFALRTFDSYYSSFRGRTRYYWNLFYQNNFSSNEIETENSILKHRFRVTGSAMQKLISNGQVWVNLQLRDDRGLSQSFYIKITNDESGTKINVVNEGTEDGEFVVFGEDKSLPENETVDVDLSALEFGGFDLKDATIEISDNPLYGTVGEPSLVENSGEFARWRVSYTSTSETQQLDSIGFIVSHPARDEQFKAYARLEIIEVPDQPVLNSIADQQIQEDESLSLKLDYSDPDSELSVSVTSTDEDNISLQIVDGTLNVTPNLNYNGNVEILVSVTEADSDEPASVLETFNLQILPVNDQPIMSAITDTEVSEDNSIELKLQASDADEELATFEYTATTDQPENVEISIEADVMTITPVADYNGDLTFYVKADDGEGTLSSVSEPETFVLKVNPVNDSPEVSRTIATQSIVEGLPAYTIDLSDYFSDPDVESSELTYSVGSVSNVSLTVNGSILTIQSVDGAEGLETVTITASDGVLSASQDVSFVASASSDEITVANALSDLNLEEDFDLQVIDISDLFAYSNDANAEFTYQLSGNNSVSAAISGTSLEIGALENFNGTDQLYIIGSTDGISAYSQININVSAVNDAPELVSSISDLSVLEDVAISRAISDNIFSDVDGDVLTYFAQFGANWLSFDASTRTFSGTPQNDDVGTVEVTLTAEDPSGAKATDTFQIVVSNTNDDPTDIG
ncbi:MAG: putative Ig domain-containing protein, partial [Cytophagia bacterium]|nr:putative Ig domain-containing protein [Cytophagia bacterium]